MLEATVQPGLCGVALMPAILVFMLVKWHVTCIALTRASTPPAHGRRKSWCLLPAHHHSAVCYYYCCLVLLLSIAEIA